MQPSMSVKNSFTGFIASALSMCKGTFFFAYAQVRGRFCLPDGEKHQRRGACYRAPASNAQWDVGCAQSGALYHRLPKAAYSIGSLC